MKITYIYRFVSFTREQQKLKSAEELWNNVSREGVTVGEMLSSVKVDVCRDPDDDRFIAADFCNQYLKNG